MGLKNFFSKIGGGLADFGRLPLVPQLVVAIPVAGPWLSLAMKRAAAAEDIFKDKKKSGTQKMAWAAHQLGKDFKAAGISDKRIHGAIELALLLLKNEAFLEDPNDKVAEAASQDEAPPPATKPNPNVPGSAPEKENNDEPNTEGNVPTSDDGPAPPAAASGVAPGADPRKS